MPVNQEAFENLVFLEIAGVISEEDNARLQAILEADPEARAIREQMLIDFPPELLKSMEENLAKKLAVPVVRAELAQRNRRRNLKRFFVTLIFLIIIFSAGWEWRLSQLRMQRPDMLGMDRLEYLTLKLSDGQLIHLGKLDMFTSLKGLFYKDKRLTWSGSGRVLEASIHVPTNQQASMIMSDGSVIDIDGGTVVDFPTEFGVGNREVRVKGKAKFEVKADAEHPFIVNLPHLRVKVLGTVFNVRTNDSNAVRVELNSGALRLYSAGDSVTMAAGEVVQFKPGSGLKVETLGNNKHQLIGKSLRELLPFFGRVYGKRFLLDNPVVGRKMISGVLEADKPIDSLLKYMYMDASGNDSLVARYVGDSVVIIGRWSEMKNKVIKEKQ